MLPSLTLPRGLPCWLAAGHGVELTPIYADTPMRSGHSRKRRVYRQAPRVVSVGMVLNQAQTTAFFRWFEDSLQAGAASFSTRIPNQGPGLVWWRARFFEPPTYEALGKLHQNGEWTNGFRVAAKLLLTGSGSNTGPAEATMASTATVALSASADVTVEKRLASVATVALLPALRLRSSATVALVPAAPTTSRSAAVAESAAAASIAAAIRGGDAAGAESLAVASACGVGLALAVSTAETAAATDAHATVSEFADSLLYASFAGGTALDESPTPATITTSGTTATYSDGKFVETDGGVGGYGLVAWSGGKFSAVPAAAWTLECDVAWSVIPNAAQTRIVGLVGATSGIEHQLVFYSNAGVLNYIYGSSAATTGSLPSGSARTHLALVSDGAGGGRVYVGGSLVYSGSVPVLSSDSSVLVRIGKSSNQGDMNYTIDNVRLRIGALYSGSTITPPTYSH